MPGTAARTLACAAELLARFLKLKYDGIAIASRIPRMMMTTSSSIRVKPLSSEARRFRRVLIMCDVLLPEVGGPSGIGCLSESVRPEGVKRRRARSPAPFYERPSSVGLADAGRDRPVRAALEVRDGAGARVLDAVARDGGAGRLRSAPERGCAAHATRARGDEPARGVRQAHAERDPAAPLSGPLERAAEAARDRPAARPLARGAGPRPLPRQRLLPARVARSRVPPHPRAAEDARGAAPARDAARVRGPAARARPRHGPDRLR